MTTLSRDVMTIGRVKSVEPNGQKAQLLVRLADEMPTFLVPRDLGRLVRVGAAVCLEGYLRKEGLVFVKTVSPLGASAE